MAVGGIMAIIRFLQMQGKTAEEIRQVLKESARLVAESDPATDVEPIL